MVSIQSSRGEIIKKKRQKNYYYYRDHEVFAYALYFCNVVHMFSKP